ncbi:M13 family metallopeptidase [Parvularcula dongshanensis]|uniref:Putative metalloendopeptidase n=1 Tax=Parvularcula dongshanensis TaxID=1173995 RepID=A0A840I733_9PROT|nr:M13-type metalloendopeptidase [Parvularcula dongshanensis]MBB4659984.1 putative metalloendopeptidase [Parvularcula dongshanensis]
MKRQTLLGCAATLALLACGTQQAPTDPQGPEQTTSARATTDAPELGTFGIETADIDQSVDPGDDFFRYVNGRWLDTFEIPAEFSSYGAFTVLFERSEDRVRDIITDSAAAAEAGTVQSGSNEQKIGDYFAAYLDTQEIEAKGMAPIQADLDAYDALETHEDVAAAFANVRTASESPVGLYVNIDSKNPEQYAVYLTQSGLGLPNRDYYLKAEFADKAEAYRAFLAQMLTFAGEDDVQSKADAVYALEKRLAEAHWEPAKQRDRDLTYNPYTIETLAEYAPGMPWRSMFEQLGIDPSTPLIAEENDALRAEAEIFRDTPVEVWSDYLKAHALVSYADVLPSQIDDAVFDFYGRTLRGVPQQRERWKRGVAAVNGALGEAIGEVYVDRYFPAESKAQMERLVANLKTAFEARLRTLDWMSPETREQAEAKLASFTTKIAYPDEWHDYSSLEVDPDDALGNKKRADLFAFNDMISKLGGPIDEGEWFMTPQTINAYYSPNRNEIVFPAAILQAPFFDPNADPAVNYGGIGAVIGHEIGHGFDDQGRKSDGTGMLRDWWTEADAAGFEEKTEQLGAQYGSYSPVEGFYVNPGLTMGENIGDLGGLTMAYDAYKLSLNGKEAPVIDGMTGDQRFFAAWAQVWKTLYREDELKNRLTTDPHSPGQYRTNGVVRNMDAWYEAFDVGPDDDLYLPPEERVRIW